MTVLFWCSGLVCPVICALAGWLLWKHPPRERNNVIGYRTRRSGRSQAAWDFAQVYSGRWMLRSNLVSLGVSAVILLLVQLLCPGGLSWGTIVLMCAQVAVLIAVIPATERQLKRRFPEQADGGMTFNRP